MSRERSATSTSARLAATLGTLSLGLALGSCANGEFATLSGAGDAFPRAQYQVLGQTKYDQTWIDRTIEAEVAGFHFARPARRPASLSTRRAATRTTDRIVPEVSLPPVAAEPTPTPTPQPGVVAPPKVRRTWRQRYEELNDKLKKLEHRG
jgi:hypothetical protein